MSLSGLRVAILVENLYEDRELWYPHDRLREEGATVTLVGPEAGRTYQSKHGVEATADRAASDVSADDFEAVIIPGGYSPDHMRRCEAMVRLVKEAVESDRIVAAICHAGWMLCSADVLKNRRVTSFSSIRDDMRHAGADWVDEEVVQDGNLITSRHPGDLPAFMKKVIAACSDIALKA